MIKFVWLCIIALSSSVAFAENITVLVLGDSISAAYGLPQDKGWVKLLETRLQASHPDSKVVNASITGDTTTGGLKRLPQALQQHRPDIAIIELGGNDGLRGQSLKNMRNNLVQMIQLGQSAKAKVLLLGMRIPSNYGPAYTERFQRVFQKASEATGAALMPFFLEPIATDRRYFQSDGIHPSIEAQEKLLDGMWPFLQPLL